MISITCCKYLLSAIGDIDISGINSDIEIEIGVGLGIGYRYDVDKTRVEGTWLGSNLIRLHGLDKLLKLIR